MVKCDGVNLYNPIYGSPTALVGGDPEIMVSALMKRAYENQVPTDLKPMDELLSSHPSIVKRIAALRALP